MFPAEIPLRPGVLVLLEVISGAPAGDGIGGGAVRAEVVGTAGARTG